MGCAIRERGGPVGMSCTSRGEVEAFVVRGGGRVQPSVGLAKSWGGEDVPCRATRVVKICRM